ncbi:hypothetical protein MNBD_GAMMA05-833 [hydrothermal vent metagenome]|uniref:Uncharacterized protein n=1 Tax=hydrothermal vent metagenome TaxID=652676 RepID=A0A3B0W7M9_9ZZZZ
MSAYIIFNYKILDCIKIEEIRGLITRYLKNMKLKSLWLAQ